MQKSKRAIVTHRNHVLRYHLDLYKAGHFFDKLCGPFLEENPFSLMSYGGAIGNQAKREM